jgi:hypothetical protein
MGAISAIGSVLPVLSGITGTLTALDRTFGAISSINKNSENAQQREQELALKQLKQQQSLQQQQSAEQAGLERQKASLQATEAEETRRLALRRAVSRQRAQFGAQGVGSNTGSSEAVLLGLFDESDDERSRREELDTLRNRALDTNLAQEKSLNLLQATQLAQRQKLSRLI